MEAKEEQRPAGRGRRAFALIVLAAAIIATASWFYLRPPAPPRATVFPSPAAVASLGGGFDVAYDFPTPALGWAAVTESQAVNPRLWIFKTTDGARRWSREFTAVSTASLPSIDVFDRDHAVVWVSGQLASAYATADSGGHWTDVALPPGTVDGVFADARHGWALTFDPRQQARRLFATTDGGRTWGARSLPADAVTRFGTPGLSSDSLQFRADGEGWLGTNEQEPAVYLTRDGGATWTRTVIAEVAVPPSSPRASPAQPVAAFDIEPVLLPGRGVVVLVLPTFADPLAFTSFDGGRSWSLLATPPNPTTYDDFAFLDSRRWWAMRFGFLYKSSDSGDSWRAAHVAPQLDGWDYQPVHVIDDQHAWCVMTGTARMASALSMTSDGGATWVPVAVPQPG